MTDLLETTEPQASQNTDLLASEQTPDEEKAIMQKRINDGQEFIETMKQERQLDRERIAELEATVTNMSKTIPSLETLASQKSEDPSAEVKTDTLSAESVADTVLGKIQEKQEAEARAEQQRQQQAEADKVYSDTTAKLVEMYGDKAKEVLTQKLGEKGISLQKAKVMMSDAEMAPLFLANFSASQGESTSLPSSSVNTTNVKPNQTEKPLGKMTSIELANYMQQQRKGN